MAYETGTATNYNDFIAKLTTFALAQGWTKPWQNADATQFVLRGPGVSGGEPVYLGFRLAFNAIASTYDVFMRGMTALNTSALTLNEHIGTSKEVGFMLDENPMTYWFFVNDRRILGVAKISTVFESFYGGFFLPYGTPVNYPRPYFIGGTRGDKSQPDLKNWRSAHTAHSAAINRPYRGQDDYTFTANAFMLNPFGEWNVFCNVGNQYSPGRLNYMLPRAGASIAPDINRTDWPGFMIAYEGFTNQLTHNIDGGYSMLPLHLVSAEPTVNTWGILHDVFFVPGFDNAAENTITLADGTSYIVFQDTFRTDHHSYFAVKLG